MKLIIEGEPKEIAALVLATQERRRCDSDISLFLNREKVAQYSIDVLKRELSAELRRAAKFVPETADGPCVSGLMVESTAAP